MNLHSSNEVIIIVNISSRLTYTIDNTMLYHLINLTTQ